MENGREWDHENQEQQRHSDHLETSPSHETEGKSSQGEDKGVLNQGRQDRYLAQHGQEQPNQDNPQPGPSPCERNGSEPLFFLVDEIENDYGNIISVYIFLKFISYFDHELQFIEMGEKQ